MKICILLNNSNLLAAEVVLQGIDSFKKKKMILRYLGALSNIKTILLCKEEVLVEKRDLQIS